jgi:hypothetical protein
MDELTKSDIFGILEFSVIAALIVGVLFTALFYEFWNNKNKKK